MATELFNVELQRDRLNAAMRDLAGACGALEFGSNAEGGKRFVQQQAGLMNETLRNLTPPKERSKTAKAIELGVDSKFKAVSETHVRSEYKTQGDTIWYAWNSHALYGSAKDKDMTGASVDALYQMYYRITKAGRVRVGQRGKQSVYLWQKTITKQATLNKLKTKIKAHIGRLKCGWLVSWNDLGRPGKAPAQWIARHLAAARGYSVNGLGIPNAPTFTLANTAAGAGKLDWVLKAAVEVRIRAMAKDMHLYLTGIKEKWRL